MSNVSWYSTRLKKKERGGSLQNVKGLSINQRQGDESEKRRWLVLKRPRGDTNGVGEDDVTVYHTVTSGQHAQAERAKKTEKRRGSYMATSDVGSGKGPELGDVAQSRSGLFIIAMARD